MCLKVFIDFQLKCIEIEDVFKGLSKYNDCTFLGSDEGLNLLSI